MTQDVFIEKIVARKMGPRQAALIALLVLVSLLLIFAALLFFPYLGAFTLPVIAGVCWLAYYVMLFFRVEHEYILTNGELDIDRIIARRRRKRLFSVDISSFEMFAPVNEANQKDLAHFSRTLKITDCGSAPSAPDRFFAVFTPKKGGKGRTLLIFEPDERMVADICKRLPGNRKL